MEAKKRAAFITLGCKVNTAETEGMKRLFQQAGYTTVGESDFADVYIVNTCTVTGMGDKKSRQMLRRAHSINPDAIIAAVGCFAQVSPDEASKIEGVNLVVGNNMKHSIVELVENVQKDKTIKYVNERKALTEYEELPVETYEGHTRAFLKIQDGCEEFCSYCIIPYARGPVRSRETADIIKEARNFSARGFKEIVLTGINLTAYGTDKKGQTLSELIHELHSVEGIERIRLGSLEPMFLSRELIKDIKHLPKLCPHFHLSLQSGSEQVLRRMNRRYTPNDFRKTIQLLREQIPDVTFTTDVMTGFPGETDEEFMETFQFCEEIGFLWMHVFKYSQRKGTPAARFKDQVDPTVKEKRSKSLIKLAESMRQKVFEQYAGREMKILLEQPVPDKLGNMEGLTPNYISVAVKVQNEKSGEIVNVTLKETEGERMRGVLTVNE